MKILRIRNKNFLLTTTWFFIILNASVNATGLTKQKRQLFREQVLPYKGGKIPDSAFQPQRLLLNRLNQQGISVPDGIVLDQRQQNRHPFPKQKLPETLKVVLTNDGRYVAPPGRYYYSKQPTVDTTYIIRTPHRSCCKGTPVGWAPLYYSSEWLDATQNSARYQNYIGITNWKPPVWYNSLTKPTTKPVWTNTLSNFDLDPSQILVEYSSYLEKIHKDYNK